MIPKHFITRKKEYNKLAYGFIIIGFILALPQLYEIYTTKNVEGISIVTWLGWGFLSFFWFLYGIETHETPIAVSAVAKLIVNVAIIYGVVLYGGLL